MIEAAGEKPPKAEINPLFVLPEGQGASGGGQDEPCTGASGLGATGETVAQQLPPRLATDSSYESRNMRLAPMGLPIGEHRKSRAPEGGASLGNGR